MPNLLPINTEGHAPQYLVLIRGIPGTAKSTVARRIRERHAPNSHHWEADMYFETERGYIYNPKLISRAHLWCKNRTYWSLKMGFTPVIVSNTFVEMWQMVPYLNMCREFGAKLHIIELTKEYGSIHGVPETTMQRMREKWEPIDESRLIGINYTIIREVPHEFG